MRRTLPEKVQALPTLRSLTVLQPEETLCRQGGQTCAACCFGERVSRLELERRLRRHTRVFRQWVEGGALSRRRLWLHELFARPVSDLFWALLLCLPVVGQLLRPWLQCRSVCAFLGFEDDAESCVGCLIHPARWGIDLRQRAAFAFWRGFHCGVGNYFCTPAWLFRRLHWRQRREFVEECATGDWLDYSEKCRKLAGPHRLEDSPVGLEA
jgi:hypothetical protein